MGRCPSDGGGVGLRAFTGTHDGDWDHERTWGVGSAGEYGGGVCGLRKRVTEQHVAEQRIEAASERLLGPRA